MEIRLHAHAPRSNHNTLIATRCTDSGCRKNPCPARVGGILRNNCSGAMRGSCSCVEMSVKKSLRYFMECKNVLLVLRYEDDFRTNVA